MFWFGENSFLGIDIGTSTIKMIEVKLKSKKPIITNYSWAQINNWYGDLNSDFFNNVLPQYLKQIVEKGKFIKKNAYVALPSFSGLITVIEFPEMPKEDLEQAVRFEAHKYIPLPLEEVVLSWDILNSGAPASAPITAEQAMAATNQSAGTASAKKIQILLVAAPKSRVEKYQQLIRKAGIGLKNIELESFSLVRALVGNDPGNFVIVDIGFRVCNIILVEKGEIKVSRNIDAGGINITYGIAQSMNIDEDRAEKLKVSSKDFLSQQSGIIFPVLEVITEEVKRVILNYYKDINNSQINSIILSGGTAKFYGIEEYFQKALNIKTIKGDPLARIEYDKKIETAINEIRPQLAVCVGLVLKGIEEKTKK